MALSELLDPAIPEARMPLDFFLGYIIINHLSLLKLLWVRLLSANRALIGTLMSHYKQILILFDTREPRFWSPEWENPLMNRHWFRQW